MDLLQGLRIWIRDKLLFQKLNPVSLFFQDNKVIIHNGIEEAVCEIIGPHLSDPTFPISNPFADGLEDITFALLKRKDKIPAYDEAHLLRFCLAPFAFIMKHFQDHIEIIYVVFHFGSLLCVEDVLQDQRMQSIAFPQLFQDFRLMESIDVDPGDGGLLLKNKTFFDDLYFAFVKLGLIVIKYCYLGHPHLLGSLSLIHISEPTRRTPI